MALALGDCVWILVLDCPCKFILCLCFLLPKHAFESIDCPFSFRPKKNSIQSEIQVYHLQKSAVWYFEMKLFYPLLICLYNSFITMHEHEFYKEKLQKKCVTLQGTAVLSQFSDTHQPCFSYNNINCHIFLENEISWAISLP